MTVALSFLWHVCVCWALRRTWRTYGRKTMLTTTWITTLSDTSWGLSAACVSLCRLFFFCICISFYWYADHTQVELQANPSDSPFCPWSVSVFVLHPHSLQRANWSRSWYGCCPPKSSWLGPPFTSCWSPNFVACLWKSVLAWWPPHSAFTSVHVVR